MWSPETLIFIAVTFFLGGIAKGTVGLGFPVIAMACLAPVLGLKVALGLLIVPGIVTNIWQALAGGAFRSIVSRLWSLLLFSIAGIWAGVQVLKVADPALLIGILGTLLFLYSAISLTRPQISPPGRHEFWLSPTMGAAGGFMFGLTGSYMVPGVLYIQALGMRRDEFVQALGIVFITIMVALALFLTRNQLLPADVAIVSTAALVPIALGMLAGQQLRKWFSEEKFRTLLFAALCVAGLYMIARAAMALSLV